MTAGINASRIGHRNYVARKSGKLKPVKLTSVKNACKKAGLS